MPQDFFGVAATPLVEGNRLIVNVGAPGGPSVIALDKLTGELVWKTGDQWGPSYASPVPATVSGKRRIFVFAGGESRPPTGGLLSIDPADGKIDFRFPWRSRSYESVNASNPVVVGNQVLISASYKTGAALLDLLPDGTHRLAWTAPHFGLHWNTAIHREGYLYGFDGRNEPDAALVCIDLKTGKEMWRAVPEWEETVEFGGRRMTRTFTTHRGSLLWGRWTISLPRRAGPPPVARPLSPGLPDPLPRLVVRRPRVLVSSGPEPGPALRLPESPRLCPGRIPPAALLRPAGE